MLNYTVKNVNINRYNIPTQKIENSIKKDKINLFSYTVKYVNVNGCNKNMVKQ